MTFTLPDLPYDKADLAPHIDAKTMETQHGKHHAGYVAKLNAAIQGTELESKSIKDILSNLRIDGTVKPHRCKPVPQK